MINLARMCRTINTKEIREKKSIKRNFSFTFIGNAIYALTQWLYLMIITKTTSPTTVGQYTLGLAVTAPIYMLLNLQLRSILATDVKKQFQFGGYLGLRLVTVGISLLIISVIVFFGGYSPATSVIVLLVGLSKGIESISDVIFGKFQAEERMDIISKSLIFKGLLSLFISSLLLLITNSLIISLIGLNVSWLIIMLLIDIRNLYKFTGFKPNFNYHVIFQIIKISLPLGIVMMLLSLNTNIPRYFIENQLGLYELGIYAAIAYIVMAGNTVISALGQSASPRLAKYFANENKSGFVKLLGQILLFGLFISGLFIITVIFFGKLILQLIYTSEYSEYQYIFLLISIGAGISFISSFMGYSITAARNFKVQPFIAATVILVTIISCYFLIPTYGLLGAAISYILSSLIQCMLNSIVILTTVRQMKNKEG